MWELLGVGGGISRNRWVVMVMRRGCLDERERDIECKAL